MEFLGVTDGISDNGTIVVIGTEDIPDTGDPVFDSKERRIGTVKRIFGPVEGPFITVAVCDTAVLKNVKGMELYTRRRTQNGKDKRRNRRN
ncbi:MAG: hypothetical protein LBJ20_02680 [Candidatus Methanoplasma sp.]|jgi:RNA-binding protein|nr:hypothetical protein [Candidatus Methanoplasma sp.]